MTLCTFVLSNSCAVARPSTHDEYKNLISPPCANNFIIVFFSPFVPGDTSSHGVIFVIAFSFYPSGVKISYFGNVSSICVDTT